MNMQIVATTDGRYLGRTFDSTDNPIVLSDDVLIYIERTMALTDGLRFISSNYIIDAQTD